MHYPGNWIDSFAENYQWSNASLITKGMAPWGAVALGEIDEVVQRLHQRAQTDEAWWEEWCALAQRIERFADTAAAEGRQASAGNGSQHRSCAQSLPFSMWSPSAAPRRSSAAFFAPSTRSGPR